MLSGILSLLLVMTMSFTIDSKRYVEVEASPAVASVENGKEFVIYLKLIPADGIHLNAVPPVSVKPGSDGMTMKVDSVKKNGDYLDVSSPLAVRCVLAGVSTGLHNLKFDVSYTFCSSTEGWCRFGKSELSVQIYVSK